MRIRKAQSVDLAAIQSLVRRTLYLPIPGFYWHRQKVIAAAIKSGVCHIVRDNGRLAALLIVSSADKPDFGIEMLAVSKRYQRRNLGQGLVSFAKVLARRRGQRKLVVSTFVEYGADRFYERIGFRQVGLEKFNGHPYYLFEMEI